MSGHLSHVFVMRWNVMYMTFVLRQERNNDAKLTVV